MDNDKQTTANTSTAWLALLVAVIALGFSVVAFNRSGKNIGTIAEEQTQEVAEEAEQAAALAAAQARLVALRTQLAAERGYAETADEVQEVRGDLQEAYADASAEAQQEWRELDRQLETTEQAARNESAEAVGALERALELLRRDIESEEQ